MGIDLGMNDASYRRRALGFVNWAHALDHFALLIFPTAVIAIAAEIGRDYNDLIWLSTGAFLAFGFFSLPVGWLADRFGRRALMAAFFLGTGASCLFLAVSPNFVWLALAQVLLGVFCAIYHPVGGAMIAANAEQLGRELGVNGVWGNMGAAFASAITGVIAASLGWRAAFAIPGLVMIASGIAFLILVKDRPSPPPQKAAQALRRPDARRAAALALAFALALIAGGMTFNITTISLPKVIDERLGIALPLAVTGGLATAVFFFGAATQIVMGRLIDRIALPRLFIGLSLLQPMGLGLAAATTGAPMLAGLVLAMSAIYGQVIINDAMVARLASEGMRNRAYAIRYFLGFAVSGLAAPMIAINHHAGGFPLVLAVAACFGAMVTLSAFAVWRLSAPEAVRVAS